jgi:protease PrsW
MYTQFAILIILSLAPIVLLLWYFDRLDKAHKESRRFLWSIFLWGVLVTFIAGGAEYLLESNFTGYITDKWTQLFVVAFVFVALIEEGLKFWVVKKKAFPHPAFNEHYDGVIYAVVASLGFAALENVFYVMDGGISVGVIRSVLSVPAHALFGATMGYYFSLARFAGNKNDEQSYLMKGLFYAVFWHGLYDFMLMSSSIISMIVFPMLLGLYMNVKRKINHLHVLDGTDTALKPLRTLDYIKIAIGMIFFTLGSLVLFVVLIYATNDMVVGAAIKGIDVYVTYSVIFALIMLVISARIINWKAFKKGWMAFAHGLGVINTTILLSIVFYIFVGIYAIISKIIKLVSYPFKKKPDSYWLLKEQEVDLESFKNPF